MQKDNSLTRDMQMKIWAMQYFLSEIEKRKNAHPISEGISPTLDGVTSHEENGKIFHRYNGDALINWQREMIYFAEAYIAATGSFFDILVKCLKKNYAKEDLYFKPWIDEANKRYASDQFIMYLKKFKDEHLSQLIRNRIMHNESLSRSVQTPFNLNWSGGAITKKVLVCKINENEVQLLDYLNSFNKEFITLLDELNKNLDKEYEW